jgi:glycine/D-amino acid oxidase-like deaminating enzyme
MAQKSQYKLETSWTSEKEVSFLPLTESLKVDVVVVGGGIAGVISAYLLSEEGKKVALLEKDIIASGATYRTTAILTQSIDTDFSDLVETFGLKTAKTVIDSHGKAIDLIEAIIKKNKIDCEFMRCSNFIYANEPKQLKDLEEEYEYMKKVGLKVSLNKKKNELGFAHTGFVEIKSQAKFHPLKFIMGLLTVFEHNGGLVFEGTQVTSIDSDDKIVTVKTSTQQTVTAEAAIVATYEPFNKPLSLYFKKAFYVTYMLELEMANTTLIPEATFEDTDNPYHYFRLDKKDNMSRILIGGEDHRQDLHTDKRKSLNALRTYTDEIFGKKNYKITKEWHGPILEPVDGLAFIGNLDKDNVFYAMAFSGNGMTYSAITGRLLTDLILKKKNPWAEIYSASRIPKLKALMKKGRDFSEELLNAAVKNTFVYSKKRKEK